MKGWFVEALEVLGGAGLGSYLTWMLNFRKQRQAEFHTVFEQQQRLITQLQQDIHQLKEDHAAEVSVLRLRIQQLEDRL